MCVVMVGAIVVEGGCFVFLPPTKEAPPLRFAFIYLFDCFPHPPRQAESSLHMYLQHRNSVNSKGNCAFPVLLCVKCLDEYEAEEQHICCPCIIYS